MIKKCLGLIVGLLLLTGCSEFALLSSGSSIALSNNVYAKAYSGVDLTTYLTTNKDIKTHAYEYVVKAKEVKDLVIEVLAHDFSEWKDDHLKVASSVEIKPDESIKLASTKTERTILTIDAFQLCYLSFFLAVSIVLLSMSLVYLVIHCSRQPVKVRKRKIKKKKRK